MPRAGLTPERLAVAGAELADEVGFEQVTVSAVARAFDVKVASLYSHVKSSNDLKTRIARCLPWKRWPTRLPTPWPVGPVATP